MRQLQPGGVGQVASAVWRPEELSASWLTTVLGAAGVIDAAVSDFAVTPVGTGQMGDSFRITLDTTGDAAPRTIVGKFTAADETSRTTGVSMRTAEVEVRFYQQVAPTLSVRTPACYFADVEPATARFVLLLEDLAPRSPGDQVAGCSVDEARVALTELAKVHGPRWADPALAGLEWLDRRDPESLATLAAVFPLLWSGFVDRYANDMPDVVGRIGHAFFPRIGAYLTAETGPRTVEHADYRVDNLLFGGPVSSPLAVVDWQTVRLGEAGADVAYFLGGSIEVEDRRAHEEELLRHYLSELHAHGVEHYGFDDLWGDYRRHAFSGLVMAVGAAMMVARTDRGDDMFLAMARRAAAHAEDLGALDTLDA